MGSLLKSWVLIGRHQDSVAPSSRKHGISDHDTQIAVRNYLMAYAIDDDQPAQELRLGFDSRGWLLEIVVVLLDEAAERVIHAMKARPQYFDLRLAGNSKPTGFRIRSSSWPSMHLA